jgi:uncharacterized protein YyaL (SSP411 family)
LRRPDGRLLHRYRDGEADIIAHLDDYAFFIWGLIDLYEATFKARYLRTAVGLADDMLRYYWDEKAGGFFFTPDDGEPLILRTKEIYDGAVPSGNAAALHDLLRLARFTGRPDLEEKASKMDNAFSGQIDPLPSAYTHFLVALDFAFGPSKEIVIVGPPGEEETEAMLKALRSVYVPNRVILFRPTGQQSAQIDSVAGFLKDFHPLNGKATAYVCREFSCERPTTSIQEMLALMKESKPDS